MYYKRSNAVLSLLQEHNIKAPGSYYYCSGVARVVLSSLPWPQELQEIQRRVREEKKVARRAVKEFEDTFKSQTGRKALKEDREPLEKTYR